MRSLLDVPWDSLPHDGASAPVHLLAPCDEAEDEELMYAWLRERQDNIELRFLLDRTRELLGRILADGEDPCALMRRARHLLRQIEAARKGGHDRSRQTPVA